MKGDAARLASLLGACDRGLARLRAVEAPPPALIHDLEELRADLSGRLEALEPPKKTLRHSPPALG